MACRFVVLWCNRRRMGGSPACWCYSLWRVSPKIAVCVLSIVLRLLSSSSPQSRLNMAIVAMGGRVAVWRRLGSQQVPTRAVQLLRATRCPESYGMDHPAVTGDDWGREARSWTSIRAPTGDQDGTVRLTSVRGRRTEREPTAPGHFAVGQTGGQSERGRVGTAFCCRLKRDKERRPRREKKETNSAAVTVSLAAATAMYRR